MFPERIIEYIEGVRYNNDSVGQTKADIFLFENNLVLKTEKRCKESDNELIMYAWLKDKLPIPDIVDVEQTERRNYILMKNLNGFDLNYFPHATSPEIFIDILVESLKLIWSIDVTNCPSNQNISHKLSLAKYQVENNLVDLENVNKDTFSKDGFENPAQLLKYLEENTPKEDLVFSHGDFTFENLFYIGDDFLGYIDLGRSGVADKYQDISLCYRGLKENFNEKQIDLFFEKLEIKPDYSKIEYFILLDELF